MTTTLFIYLKKKTQQLSIEVFLITIFSYLYKFKQLNGGNVQGIGKYRIRLYL